MSKYCKFVATGFIFLPDVVWIISYVVPSFNVVSRRHSCVNYFDFGFKGFTDYWMINLNFVDADVSPRLRLADLLGRDHCSISGFNGAARFDKSFTHPPSASSSNSSRGYANPKHIKRPPIHAGLGYKIPLGALVFATGFYLFNSTFCKRDGVSDNARFADLLLSALGILLGGGLVFDAAFRGI